MKNGNPSRKRFTSAIKRLTLRLCLRLHTATRVKPRRPLKWGLILLILARNYVLTSYSLGARACLWKLPCRGSWYVALPLYQLNPLLRVCPAISLIRGRQQRRETKEKTCRHQGRLLPRQITTRKKCTCSHRGVRRPG